MSVIKAKCIDQVMYLESTPVITSGGLEENFVQFSFCSQWDGYTRTAVFWRVENGADVYHVILDDADSCQVPPEVTADEGVLKFGIFGVNEAGVQRTSNVLTYRIAEGAITTDTKPSDPTPDVYTRMMAIFTSGARVTKFTLERTDLTDDIVGASVVKVE